MEKQCEVKKIYLHPELYIGKTLEHHTAVALRELAMEEVREKLFPQYPSRLASLYVTASVKSAENWRDYFLSLGRPVFGIARLDCDGRCFEGNAELCFDGTADREENLRLAKRYWENADHPEYFPETIIDGNILVAEIIN